MYLCGGLVGPAAPKLSNGSADSSVGKSFNILFLIGSFENDGSRLRTGEFSLTGIGLGGWGSADGSTGSTMLFSVAGCGSWRTVRGGGGGGTSTSGLTRFGGGPLGGGGISDAMGKVRISFFGGGGGGLSLFFGFLIFFGRGIGGCGTYSSSAGAEDGPEASEDDPIPVLINFSISASSCFKRFTRSSCDNVENFFFGWGLYSNASFNV